MEKHGAGELAESPAGSRAFAGVEISAESVGSDVEP